MSEKPSPWSKDENFLKKHKGKIAAGLVGLGLAASEFRDTKPEKVAKTVTTETARDKNQEHVPVEIQVKPQKTETPPQKKISPVKPPQENTAPKVQREQLVKKDAVEVVKTDQENDDVAERTEQVITLVAKYLGATINEADSDSPYDIHQTSEIGANEFYISYRSDGGEISSSAKCTVYEGALKCNFEDGFIKVLSQQDGESVEKFYERVAEEVDASMGNHYIVK